MKTNVNPTFGTRIKELREEKGWSQTKLAAELDKKESTVRTWELDRSIPPTNVLIEIADKFEVNVDYLLGRNNVRTYDVVDEYESVAGRLFLNLKRAGGLEESLMNSLSDIIESGGVQYLCGIAGYMAQMGKATIEYITNDKRQKGHFVDDLSDTTRLVFNGSETIDSFTKEYTFVLAKKIINMAAQLAGTRDNQKVTDAIFAGRFTLTIDNAEYGQLSPGLQMTLAQIIKEDGHAN